MRRHRFYFLPVLSVWLFLSQSLLRAETYVTEENVQIDRCACAWFILRFIDEDAEFKFFKNGAQPPKGIGFDYFGAPYFHKGPDCSFTAFIKKHPCKDKNSQKALITLNSLVNDVFAWRDGPKSQSSLFRLAIEELRLTPPDDLATIRSTLPLFDYVFLQSAGTLPDKDRKTVLLAIEQQLGLKFGEKLFTEIEQEEKQTPAAEDKTYLRMFLNQIEK